MKITKLLLQIKGACASQVALFAETFPHGTEITEAVCLAVADKFDWNWAAQNLLSPESYAEYERVRAQADAECQHVCAPAYAEYQRVRAPAYAECQRVRAATFGRLANTAN